jgi:hypothetical protein
MHVMRVYKKEIRLGPHVHVCAFWSYFAHLKCLVLGVYLFGHDFRWAAEIATNAFAHTTTSKGGLPITG